MFKLGKSKGRPRRGQRIAVSMALVLGFVGVAPLTVFSVKLIELTSEALGTAQREQQHLLARSIGENLEREVDALGSEVQRVAQTLGAAVRPNGAVRSTEVREALQGVADERIGYLRFSWFAGQKLATIGTGELTPDLEPLVAEGIRAATESQVGNDHRVVVSISEPVLVGQAPAHAVSVISAPVVSGGRFRGVLSAVVDLQTIWRRIDARSSGHTVYAMDLAGKVFASTDRVGVRPGFVYNTPLTAQFIERSASSKTAPFEVTDEQGTQEFLGSFQVTRQGWGVFVQAPADEIFIQARRLARNTAIWAIASLLIAVVIAFFFARTLSGPIKRLVAATRTFARGDFSSRVEVRSRNEIGELGETFNQMADDLELHIQRLEHAVNENSELFFGTIRALAQAIDAKDPYTRGHSMRVNRYSVIIARHMGLSGDELQAIHVASLLHDVGKIGIDDAVLKKPGKLTDEEFEIIKRHPVLGADIMAPIAKMQHILPGLRWHHEKWAGGGYPDGLVGDQIPLMARIIAVADTFDAMTTHRPYQTAMTYQQALDRINTVLVGTALDPGVVEAFNTACEMGRIRPEAEMELTERNELDLAIHS